MSIKDTKVISIRREQNSDLIRRMRNGESLTSYDSSASWFPPRPVVEKDKEAIARLYGKAVRKKSRQLAAAVDEEETTLTILPTAQ